MRDASVETVIVGGGQAGLATSYHLTQLGHEHIVLEQAARPAPVWSDERWDSFTLVTPNWSFQIPGVAYDGPDPDGFLSRQEVVARFADLVARSQLPVICDTRVAAIAPEDGGYRVHTSDRVYAARNVVVATGFFQRPKRLPAAAALSPAITQLDSRQYRNPAAIPACAVLVVGSGQSGCQIAEELNLSDRTVYLSTGTAGRAPRRYRGKDIIAWLDETGFFDLIPDQLPPGMSRFEGIPHLSGTRGGHTINLHQFARDDITLLGHLRGGDGNAVTFAPDLHQNLAKVDGFARDVTQMIDGYVATHGLDAPPEELPEPRHGYDQPLIEQLDLRDAGISTIIWAVGYDFDYSFVQLPVLDADGFPVQESGVTSYPGLYFAGMPWMPGERSGFLLGVGDATAHIAAHIVARAAPARPLASGLAH